MVPTARRNGNRLVSGSTRRSSPGTMKRFSVHHPFTLQCGKANKTPYGLFGQLPYTPQNVNRGKWGRLVDLSLITSIGFIPNRPVDGYPVSVAVRVKGAGSRIDSQLLRRQWWLGSQPLTSGHFMFYIYIYTRIVIMFIDFPH